MADDPEIFFRGPEPKNSVALWSGMAADTLSSLRIENQARRYDVAGQKGRLLCPILTVASVFSPFCHV